MRVLLRAQRRQRAAAGVEVEGLLVDAPAAVEKRRLAGDLGLDPALEEPKAVHVLELGLGPELVAARRA